MNFEFEYFLYMHSALKSSREIYKYYVCNLIKKKFREKYSNSDFEAYEAEPVMNEIVPNWLVYRILLIGKSNQKTVIKVCLPMDESENALCSDQDEPCLQRASYLDQEKKKNEDYIEKIKHNYFAAKSKNSNTMKQQSNQNIVSYDKTNNSFLSPNDSTANNE